MTQNLTVLYRKFYETYSKQYGPNTCILLLAVFTGIVFF
jgi:hypothetical protein